MVEGQKKILVVEDEDTLRNILVRRLSDDGLVVLHAADGAMGLQVALHERPDLIVLDIMMPHDGITMLEQLRADAEYGSRVPVIFLTNATPDTERIIHAIETYEPAFYLIKANLSPTQVLEKVKEALATREG